jgi:hypothetical protein
MANITGVITVNSKDVLEVDAIPSAGGGTPASVGSISMYEDGSNVGHLYLKVGAADTAWSELTVSSGQFWLLDGNTEGAEKDFGTTDDFDIPIIRNNLEVARVIGSTAAASGLLIGLSASLGGRLQLAPDAAGDDIMKEVLSPTADPVIKVSRMFRETTTGAASSAFDIAIPTAYNARVIVDAVARQTGGATGSIGDGASYQRSCHARNLAGTTVMFKQQTDYTYEIVNGLNFDLSASGANIVGTCTGVTNRNISWGFHSQILMITT